MTHEVEQISLKALLNFFPRQLDCLNATKKFKYVLYGGSMGSGKSYFLRWVSVYWLMYWFAAKGLRGVRVGLFCENFPALNDRHLSKIKAEFPAWLGTYNEQRHEFTLAPHYGSGVLAFRNLDDVGKYLSVEFASIAIDEVNRNPKSVFDLLRTRLRWPGIVETKFIGACNPIGEAWVKNFWIKRLFPVEEQEPQEFYFVKALPSDNTHLDKTYFEGLKSMPEAERKAYLEGDWDAFNETMDGAGWIRLMNDTEFAKCQTGKIPHGGYHVLGVDPAAGGDKSTIVLRSNNAQEILFDQKLPDTMDLVSITYELAREHEANSIVIDKGGVGQGVYDRMKQFSTLNVKGANFGEAAENPDQFVNRKAELYWRQRQWLLGGGRLIHNPGWHEFEIIKYKMQDDNHGRRVKIQPKEDLFKQGLPSPNCVDAAVLTQMVTDHTIRTNRVYQQRNHQFYDHMKTIWTN